MGSADVLPTTCSRSARNCTHVKHRLGICRGSGQAQAWLGPLGLETEEVTAGSVRLNSEVETGGAQSKQPSWALLRPSFFI